jgi:hypothetical protein
MTNSCTYFPTVKPVEPPIEIQLPCQKCGRATCFVVQLECANGWLGQCFRCEVWSFAPFTHTNSEESYGVQ